MTDQSDSPSIAQALIDTGTLTEDVKQSAIEAILKGQSKGVEGIFEPELTGRKPSEAAAYTMVAEGVGAMSSEELFALAQQTAASEDGSADYDAAARKAAERTKALHERLEAHTFDPKTGAKIHFVRGQAREAMILQAKAAWQEAELASYTAQAVAARRAERASLREANDAEQALKLAWAGTDPARQKVLDDALLRAEADDIARKVLAIRRGGR